MCYNSKEKCLLPHIMGLTTFNNPLHHLEP